MGPPLCLLHQRLGCGRQQRTGYRRKYRSRYKPLPTLSAYIPGAVHVAASCRLQLMFAVAPAARGVRSMA